MARARHAFFSLIYLYLYLYLYPVPVPLPLPLTLHTHTNTHTLTRTHTLNGGVGGRPLKEVKTVPLKNFTKFFIRFCLLFHDL